LQQSANRQKKGSAGKDTRLSKRGNRKHKPKGSDQMTMPRRYSVSDVRELVELFRDDPDILPQKFEGMLEVANLLAYFEQMTDEEIEAETRKAYRHQRNL
jgi:hypothetical protein